MAINEKNILNEDTYSPLGVGGSLCNEKNILNEDNPNSPLGVGGSLCNEDNILNEDTYPPLGVGGSYGVNMFYGALPILFVLAKKLRDNQTEAELFLWSQLANLNYLKVRFKRQHPVLYFIADFYCHKAKLIIEVDGGYHDIPEQYQYDKEREHELEDLGLKVIRFTNEQVLFNIENTLKEIEKEVKKRTPKEPPTPKGEEEKKTPSP